MLYTRKGDKGDTYFFGCNQRFMKSSDLAEGLGAVDEINSLLGFCKTQARTRADSTQTSADIKISGISESISEICEVVQQDLFIIQANLAGAKDKKIAPDKIQYLEKIIDACEKEMPPIKTFFLSGGVELSALFDYARAVARRAERRVVALKEEREGGKEESVDAEILAYMNRLSSLLYALARFVNFKSKISETSPNYQR